MSVSPATWLSLTGEPMVASAAGDDMLALEGSERFVDVSRLGGHRANQLRIVTAQALIEAQSLLSFIRLH
jgi:hypothetical protein